MADDKKDFNEYGDQPAPAFSNEDGTLVFRYGYGALDLLHALVADQTLQEADLVELARRPHDRGHAWPTAYGVLQRQASGSGHQPARQYSIALLHFAKAMVIKAIGAIQGDCLRQYNIICKSLYSPPE